MDDQKNEVQADYRQGMQDEVAKREQRKIESRQDQRSIWYGLGMFGLVGWSIAIPTVAGIFIGLWLDRRWDHPFSCTLMSMFVGLVFGCWIAWFWVRREGLFDDSVEPDVHPDDRDKSEERT